MISAIQNYRTADLGSQLSLSQTKQSKQPSFKSYSEAEYKAIRVFNNATGSEKFKYRFGGTSGFISGGAGLYFMVKSFIQENIFQGAAKVLPDLNNATNMSHLGDSGNSLLGNANFLVSIPLLLYGIYSIGKFFKFKDVLERKSV